MLSDVASGEAPAQETANAVGAPLRFLFNNPYERLTLDSVRVEIEIAPAASSGRARSARALTPAARPGQTVRVRCEVERWRGGKNTVTSRSSSPKKLKTGKYLLWIGGGASSRATKPRVCPGAIVRARTTMRRLGSGSDARLRCRVRHSPRALLK